MIHFNLKNKSRLTEKEDLKVTREDSVKLTMIYHNWSSSESAGLTLRPANQKSNKHCKRLVESTNKLANFRTRQWSITGSSCIYLDCTVSKEP